MQIENCVLTAISNEYGQDTLTLGKTVRGDPKMHFIWRFDDDILMSRVFFSERNL
jgi:hypothetical protein